MDALNLKFNAMTVNTNLADEFLKKNKEFIPIGPLVDMNEGGFVTTCDRLGNKIHVIKLSSDDEILQRQVSSSAYFNKLSGKFQGTSQPHEDFIEKFRLLAIKIEENKDLISQLEYLTRNISIDDAQANVQLITQNLLHWSTEFMKKSVGSAFLFIGSETPLLDLGFITHILFTFEHVVIVSSDVTAVVCHLFAKLCHKVGLDNVNLVFVTNLDDIRDLKTICIGVITEKSDLDSAVDVILASSNTAPWKFRRILVQESVYEQFKDVLTWKTNLRPVNSDNEAILNLKTKCTDVFAYDKKLLLLDYVETEVNDTFDQQIILIEAYRTTKEVMSMCKTYKAFYVSLWSNDISEANEIAYGIDALIVWINDFANFNGPEKVSQVIYSKLDHKFSSRKIKKTNAITDLCKHIDAWLKLSVSNRREIISEVLINYVSDSLESSKLIKEIQDALNKPLDNFVEVTDTSICVGMNKPVGIVASHNNYLHLILSSVYGNGVIFLKKDFQTLIHNLKIAGVPIVILDSSQKGDFKVAFDCPYQTKVVWTNFGTIFAN